MQWGKFGGDKAGSLRAICCLDIFMCNGLHNSIVDDAVAGLEIHFFGGSKTNFVVAKLYVHVLRNENILILYNCISTTELPWSS